MNDDRVKLVAFGDEAVQKAFEELKQGRFEEKQLVFYIQRVIEEYSGGYPTKSTTDDSSTDLHILTSLGEV